MPWGILVSSAAGVACLFYGLWQRSKRTAAEKDADQIGHLLDEQSQARIEDAERYEALISLLRAKLEELKKDAYANIPREDLAGRINAILKWGVHTSEAKDSSDDSSDLPTPSDS